MYWTDETKILMNQYCLATSKAEKDAIYLQLYPALEILIIDASASIPFKFDIRKEENEDILAELRLFLYDVILPKIKLQQLQSAQAYIWRSARNKIMVRFFSNVARKKRVNVDYVADEPSEEDKEPIEWIHAEIIDVFNAKIKAAENRRNRKQTLFLLLLKSYIQQHAYDATGASTYICKMLRIKESTFQSFCYQNSIKAFLFLKKNKEQ